MTHSTEVTWTVDDIVVHGTVTVPDGDGPFPAVVLVAGSGPTDRDWCSPLLPGTNGSGRLFAEAFAAAGIASLRYDKRVSGPYASQNLPRLIGRLSMQSHLDELVGAVETLAARADIDTDRIVGMGNSEGALHVLHHALGDRATRFAGLVLAAPPGRSIRQVLMTQLAQQVATLPDGNRITAAVKSAMDRFQAGEPMNLDDLPQGVAMVLGSFENPANLPLARELWNEDPAALLRSVRVETLVLIGGRDLQIDRHADGEPLQQATEAMDHVSFVFPPNANHVFKEDTRTPEQAMAEPGNGYNTAGTRLDPESVDTVTTWLGHLFASDATGPARP